MQDRRTTSGALRRWTARSLFVVGAAMLAWCVYFLADGFFAQRQAREALRSASRAAVDTSRKLPDLHDRDEEGAAPYAAPPVRGAAIAEIAIPRIRLASIVLHGSDAKTLRRGPGHLENTPLPGEIGNAVIAGHRDTFFRALRDIRIGDDIYTDTPAGRFHYRVESMQVVKPQDLAVLAPSDEAVLTLITCYPFWVLGDAPDRFVVRAVGVAEPAAVSFVPPPARPPEAVPVPISSTVLHETQSVPDDETMIRQTVERFRATYNARLASHETSSALPLVFESCTVQVEGDTASAACKGARPPDDGDPSGRDFELERRPEGWAIRSIVAR